MTGQALAVVKPKPKEKSKEPWRQRLVRSLLYGRNVDRAAKASMARPTRARALAERSTLRPYSRLRTSRCRQGSFGFAFVRASARPVIAGSPEPNR